MKTPNGQCTERCRWLTVTKTKKTLETKKTKKTTTTQQHNFQRVLAGTRPPSKESRTIFFCVFFGMLSAFVASAACMWQYLQNFLFTCIVGLPETHVQVQVGPRQDYTCIRNWLPKFLTWDSKCLEWPCMWWVEADHCYVHVRLVKPCCSKIGSKHSYISHAHYIKGWKNEFALHIYEKSDLPSWSLLVCDEVCTLLQDLAESLKSVDFNPWYTLCNYNCLHFSWCCKAIL